MSEPSKINLGLIGFGAWGKNLARNFNGLKVLRVICDLDPSRMQEAKKTYPHLETTRSIDEVIKRRDIEGVVIAAPPSEHRSLTLESLKAGKHVFVEKPLALRVSDGKEMTEMARRSGRLLMVGHVLEYHPAVRKLRELINAGSLGKVQYIYSHRLNFGRIRKEENALWSFAPHDVAILLRLMKESPDSVACSGGAYVNHQIADTTVTTLNFPNGVQAHIFVSWLHPFKVHRLVVVGDRQMAVFDDTQPWSKKLILYSHQIDWVDGKTPVARKAKGVPVKLKPVEPLQAECEHFVSCIRRREEPLTNGESGVQVLQILEAAQESMQQNGISIPIDSPLYFVHPTALVDPAASVGEATKIWHYSHIMSGAKIGKNCILGQNNFVGRNVKIGDNVKIQNNVSIYEGVTLEDFVFCGPSVVFTNVVNPRSEIERKHQFKPTLVRRGATLGAHCTIICGATLGRYAFVGAGAVVTKNVPDYALILGIPGRIVGWMCECGVRLEFSKEKAVCRTCGKRYAQSKDQQVERVR